MHFCRRLCLSWFLFASSALPNSMHDVSGGLLFESDHVGFTGGTVLDLTADGPLDLSQPTLLQFDIAIWNPALYGTVFSLRGGPEKYLMLTLLPDTSGDSASLSIAWHKSTAATGVTLARSELRRGKWHACAMLIDLGRGRISLGVGALPSRQLVFGAFCAQVSTFRFGYEPIQREGASFALRDIRVSIADSTGTPGRLLHQWLLRESEGEEARDQVGGRPARQSRGSWLLPLHHTWKFEKEVHLRADPSARLAYDDVRQRFLVVGRDTLFTFSRHDTVVQREPFRQPHVGRSHDIIYDAQRDRLYTFHDGGGPVTEYSRAERSWPPVDSTTEHNQHHYDNATFVDPATGDIWMFGGYGWYSFKNTFHRYDFESRQWEQIRVKGDTIPPRMGLARSVDTRGRMILAGGEGNESGRQELGLHHFYDLWRFDPDRRYVERLWASSRDLHSPIISTVAGESDSVWYVLFDRGREERDRYITYAALVAVPSLEHITTLRLDPSPAVSRLFFDSRERQFICVVEQVPIPGDHRYQVFTMEYPPISERAALLLSGGDSGWWPSAVAVFLGGSLILVLGRVFFRNMRRKRSGVQLGAEHVQKVVHVPGPAGAARARLEILGGFHLHDAGGTDLVGRMRPQVAQLFLLLLVHSGPGRDGIAVDHLTSLFWPDVDPQSARNSRNVAIRHLRTILVPAGITVALIDSHYTLRSAAGLECDYYDLLRALLIMDGTEDIPEPLVNRFVLLAGKGNLVPGMDHKWLDGVRNDLASSVTRAAGRLLAGEPRSLHRSFVQVADVALRWEPLNETAMRVKLTRLTQEGLHSAAKAEFDRFTTAYRETFMSEYPGSLQAFVRQPAMN